MRLFYKIKLVILGTLVSCYVNAQVTANFMVDDSIGCNSLIASFINLSEGTNLNYLWDFGNGSTSTQENPTVIYVSTGSYTVRLIVSDGGTSDTLTKTNYINIYNNPGIQFSTESQRIGCAPLEIEYNADITIAGAPLMTVLWDFGDGYSSSELNPTHNYTGTGNYSVSLYIQDSNLCDNSFSIENYITTTPKPTLAFNVNKAITCFDTMSVQFTNLSSGITDLQYLWNFGDGNQSIEQNPTHLFSGYNLYDIKLKVIDGYGCTDSLIKPQFIKLQELDASINILDDFLCKNEELNIINNTVGATSHQWFFGDGTSSLEMNPVKSFSDTGNFDITYIASLQTECTDTIKLGVFVDKVTARFDTDVDYICELPTIVTYQNNSEFAQSYKWHVGFENESDEENPELLIVENEQILLERNVYLKDTLIATSASGCKDTIIIDSTVFISIPKVYFTPNDTGIYDAQLSGCVPIIVDFKDKSEPSNPVDPFVSWKWDFGDGSTSIQASPNHAYNEAGMFDISMTVENESGCINAYRAELISGTPQEAMFAYTGNDTVCGSNKVSFLDLSTDPDLVNGWVWQFSDGSSSTVQNPKVQFVDIGYIDATLTVLYNNCIGSTHSMDSVLFVKGPAGSLVTAFDCNEPLKYEFTADLKGVEDWIWDFGDNQYDSTSVEVIEHTYDTIGNYGTRLIASNAVNNCGLELNKTILVRNLSASFDFGPEFNCTYDSIYFDPTNSTDAYSFSFEGESGIYLWDFQDTSSFKFSDSITYHYFTEPGDFNIELTVRDINGCTKKMNKDLHIYGIEADFSVLDSIGCSPFIVQFFDNSVADTTLVDWFWDFGNGVTSMEQNPSVSYIQQGDYNIELVVKDTLGCVDSLFRENRIFTSQPIPVFSANYPAHCFGDTINFVNGSTIDGKVIFKWDFGDGFTSNNHNVAYSYQDTGFYDVSLYMRDKFGCDSTVVKPNYVYAQPIPKADFTANNLSSSCYPKIIGFSDNSESEHIVNWIWGFGDETIISNSQNPFHTYQLPGNFDVSLQVITSIGCTDTVTKERFIEIQGPYAEINAPDSFCVNIPANISFENQSGIELFEWTTDDGESYYTHSFNKTYNEFGNRKIFLTMSSDTIGSCVKLLADSIFIPLIEAGYTVSDTFGCVPLNVSFSNTSEGGEIEYWYNNNLVLDSIGNFTYNFMDAGEYNLKLRIKNSVGCFDSVITSIEVFPFPIVEISNDTLICQADTISIFASGGNKYFWYTGSQLFDTINSTLNIFPEFTTKYVVSVVDSNNCQSTDSVLVTVQPKPVVDISTSDSNWLIIGEELNIMAQQLYGEYIQWQPEAIFDCSYCIDPTVLPLNSQMLYVQVEDENNCFQVNDSIYLTVDKKYSIDVPNAFSPNNDGINDKIVINGWGIKKFLEFRVFNPSGKLVYESYNENIEWDGYSEHGLQPEGMYIYHVKVLSYDDMERTKQGFIYLLR